MQGSYYPVFRICISSVEAAFPLKRKVTYVTVTGSCSGTERKESQGKEREPNDQSQKATETRRNLERTYGLIKSRVFYNTVLYPYVLLGRIPTSLPFSSQFSLIFNIKPPLARTHLFYSHIVFCIFRQSLTHHLLTSLQLYLFLTFARNKHKVLNCLFYLPLVERYDRASYLHLSSPNNSFVYLRAIVLALVLLSVSLKVVEQSNVCCLGLRGLSCYTHSSPFISNLKVRLISIKH